MDYVLRQGETFTRWWTPQGGRWNHRLEWNREDWLRQLDRADSRADRSPTTATSPSTITATAASSIGPTSPTASSDFADGVYDSRNVQPAAAGLTLARPGQGYAIFEVRSPYVIVPRVGRLDTLDEDCEAALVELDAPGASLARSRSITA